MTAPNAANLGLGGTTRLTSVAIALLAIAGCTTAPSSNSRADSTASTEPATGSGASASATSSAGAASVGTSNDASKAATTSSAASSASAAIATPEAPPDMVVVPEGFFMMGGEGSENSPPHEVAIARFYFDKTEVTMDAYAACISAGACKPTKRDNPFCNANFNDRGKHPVNCIDWVDADAFCKFVKKRLPTESEWEYAARGGAEERLYSWGNEEPDTTRSCYMHAGGSCEVGTHPPGAFGLYDVTGNVWEWVSTAFVPYPTETFDGALKVYRGGSWSRRFAKWMRNDLRNRYRTDEHSASVGVRCARDIAPTVCPSDADAKDGRCVRARGTPLCPRGQVPDAGVCKSAALVGATGPRPPGPTGSAPALTTASAEPPPSANETPRRVRSPAMDADCEKHYAGTPKAYQWTGGTFQAREPLIQAAGCKKRDIGVGWTSACCAN